MKIVIRRVDKNDRFVRGDDRMRVLAGISGPVAGRDLAEREFIGIPNRDGTHRIPVMEQVVVASIVGHSHLFKCQANIIAPGQEAVVHVQRISGVLYPDIEGLSINERAVPEGGGPRRSVPIHFHVGTDAVIAQAIDQRHVVRPELITAVPAVSGKATAEGRITRADVKAVVDIIGAATVENKIMLVPMAQGKTIHILGRVPAGMSHAVIECPVITIRTA